MNYIIEYHLKHQHRRIGPTAPTILTALLLGLLSFALYACLFYTSDLLTDLAVQTRQGNKHYCLIPIGLALLFSLIHGAFTGHFWDSLGIKPRPR